MINWLGQEIAPGKAVYRGARNGNSSSFKIGRVESVKGEKVRVHWLCEQGTRWHPDRNGRMQRIEAVAHQQDSHGTPSADSLVVIEDSVLESTVKRAKAYSFAVADRVPFEDLEHYIKDFMENN